MLPTTSMVLPSGARVRVCRLGPRHGEPLILLHGYPDTLQIWGRLAPLLAIGRPVIACDWPGMGASDAWPGGTTPTHQAERLRQLLDHWGVPRASVLGMDMGAQPALALAALHPGRVGRLVVMNSLVLWDEETSWEIRVLRHFGWNRWLLARAPRLVFARALRTSLPRGEVLPAAVRDDLWSCFRDPAVRTFIARLCAGYQGTLPALPALYRAITRPTLILWGDRDRHFPPAHATRLHALIPGSRLQLVAGGEHWMAWHLAEVLAQEITAFLDAPCAS
jgi:pimeloyl-ACP methyl ester carboxylesterase